jgi:DNA-directed RNA polymerase subunit H
MLVPEHIILDEEETREVLEKYSINKESLPKIHITDPVIKLIEAKEGAVVKIIRNSRTTGSAIYYRFVVAK